MGDSKILLSISLLVSGRKETRKCLDSLKPFLEELPCELILVDTGCDKETRAIIEEYTDNIVNFTWCADFSKARNAGLEKAVGKWFLYLDDDEWFEDPSEIIDFFRSGEYKNYHSACYLQRNYRDYQETGYTDANVSRMVELEKNTRFKSSIHEYLSPLRGPVKLFNTYVKHFGYIFKSNKEKYEHSKRNVDLLLEMMKKEPMEFRWDTQILQEYMGIGEFGKIIETAEKAIEKYHRIKKRHPGMARELGTFYGYLAEAYDRKYDYEKEKECIQRAFQEKELNRLAQAFLHKCAAIMHYKQEKYEKCVAAFEQYMKIYKKIGQDKDEIYCQGGILTGDTFQKNNYEDMILHGIMASVKMGREDILEEYFYELGWKDTYMLLHPDFMKIVIRHMAESEYRESYVAMAKTMAERVNNIDGVVVVLQEIERDFRSLEEQGEETEGIRKKEEFFRIVTIFSKVDHDHWYITYLKILQENRKEENEKTAQDMQKLFDHLLGHIFDIFNLDTVIWEIAQNCQIDMEPFFLRIDFDTWRNGICQWIQSSDREDIRRKEDMVRKWQKTKDIRYEFFFMKVKEGYLRHFDVKDSFEKLEGQLFDFAEAEEKFYGTFFKKNAFKGTLDILPQECRIAVRLLQVKEARMENDNKKAVEAMKKLVNVYPPLNETIKHYAKEFGKYVDRKEKDAGDARAEFLQLADTLKVKAKLYLREGNKKAARAILEQLVSYVPEDKEVEEMLEETGK